MADTTVMVTDYNFPDLSVERRELADVADVVHAEATTPEEVIETAAGADGLLVQYAEITDGVLRELDDLTVVGRWDWKLGKPINRLRGKTLGLVGFGKLPRQLVEKTSGLAFEYIAYDPYVDADEMAEQGVEKVDFEGLLAQSNAISIHVPLTDETRNLFDADAFSAMNDEAVLVNTSRGEVVDDDALADALATGEVRAAGLDVLPEEPPEKTPLFDRDEVVLTPHVAWYSEDSIDDLRRTLARDVRRVLNDEEPENPVNNLDR